MEPSGLPLALVTVVLWSLVFVSIRTAFAGIFAARTVMGTGAVQSSKS